MAQASSDNVQQIVEKRGHVKAALTRLKSYDTHGATEPIVSLQMRLDQNSSLLSRFDAINWRIIDIVAGTAEEAVHERNWDEFESSYYRVAGAIAAHIKRAQNLVVPPHIQGLRIANNSPAVTETPSLVKLPAISLPQFHGSLG